MALDPYQVAQADRILDQTTRRARKRRPRRKRTQPSAQPPVINVTVHVAGGRQRSHGSTQPGRQGDYIANDRSRKRRIAPSPG